MSVGLSVCRSVCLQSALWQNGCVDLDAAWDNGGVGRGMGVLYGWVLLKWKGQYWG